MKRREQDCTPDGVRIFGLSCEIDTSYLPKLRAMLKRQAEAHCKALILDLTEVYDISPQAVVSLTEYYRDAATYAGVLCLCGLNEGLKAVFESVETIEALPIRDTVPEAIAAIDHGEIQPSGGIGLVAAGASTGAFRQL